METSFALYPELKGKSVLVLGAAGGLGLRIAEAFASNHCNITLADVDEAALAIAATSVRRKHPNSRIESLTASVVEEGSLASSCEHARRAFGRLDISICAAGISANTPSLELTAKEWRRVIDVDLTGAFLAARAAALLMQDTGGLILNISSMWAVSASPERAAYCAAKAGVHALTASLAVEWAAQDIRVNAIGPGFVRTPLTDDLIAQGRLDAKVIEQATPLGRFGTLDEVANIGLFLASNGAKFITGQTLVSDGGWTSNGDLPRRLS